MDLAPGVRWLALWHSCQRGLPSCFGGSEGSQQQEEIPVTKSAEGGPFAPAPQPGFFPPRGPVAGPFPSLVTKKVRYPQLRGHAMNLRKNASRRQARLRLEELEARTLLSVSVVEGFESSSLAAY